MAGVYDALNWMWQGVARCVGLQGPDRLPCPEGVNLCAGETYTACGFQLVGVSVEPGTVILGSLHTSELQEDQILMLGILGQQMHDCNLDGFLSLIPKNHASCHVCMAWHSARFLDQIPPDHEISVCQGPKGTQ